MKNFIKCRAPKTPETSRIFEKKCGKLFFPEKSHSTKKNLKEDRLNLQNALTNTNVFDKVPFDQVFLSKKSCNVPKNRRSFPQVLRKVSLAPRDLKIPKDVITKTLKTVFLDKKSQNTKN